MACWSWLYICKLVEFYGRGGAARMFEPGYEYKLRIWVHAPESSQFLLSDKSLSWSTFSQEEMFLNCSSYHPVNKIQLCWTCLPVLVSPSTCWFFHSYFMWAGQKIIRWGTGFVPIVLSMFFSPLHLKEHVPDLNSSYISRDCISFSDSDSAHTGDNPANWHYSKYTMHLPTWKGLRKYDWKIIYQIPLMKFCSV